MAENEEQTVKGVANYSVGKSPYNAMQFIIQQAIRENVNTCIIVKVVGVSDGYVDVLPLVSQVSGKGEAIAPTTLYKLPFMRYHAGVAAVILNPVVGDVGLAVFASKDCSNVKRGASEPVAPASFRGNSMANGFYIGGFLNQAPSVSIELTQSGVININASTVNISGSVSVGGSITAGGDVVGGGISLDKHVHGGVQSGGSTTSKPQ